MKVLIILVVVVVLLVGVAIWAGQRDRNSPDPDPESIQGSVTRTLDRVFGGRFKDTFYVRRLTGCNRSGRTLTIGTECSADITAGDYKTSMFVLIPSGGEVRACYGFNQDQVNDCDDSDWEEKGELKADGKAKFGVSKDEAFLKLYCRPFGGQTCLVSVK